MGSERGHMWRLCCSPGASEAMFDGGRGNRTAAHVLLKPLEDRGQLSARCGGACRGRSGTELRTSCGADKSCAHSAGSEPATETLGNTATGPRRVPAHMRGPCTGAPGGSTREASPSASGSSRDLSPAPGCTLGGALLLSLLLSLCPP